MGNIFSKIFGGSNPETVEESFNKLPDEQKQQIVEVAKSYSTPAPVQHTIDAAQDNAAKSDGNEETTTDNNVASATNDTNNLDQGKTEGTKMETVTQEQATMAQPPVTQEPAPAPQPEPKPVPTVEYATKEQLTAYEKALADSNKLIADQAAIITKLGKDLDETKSQYARFVNPSKEFDVRPDMGVAHVGGQRQSYKDIAAKTFKEGR